MSIIKKWNRFTQKYLHNRFDDIVFKYRPKQYGAYQLRFASNKNLLLSVIFATTFFILTITGSYAYLYWSEPEEEENQFVQFVGFDSKVTNFTLPKGDPNADKTKPLKKSSDAGSEKLTSAKSNNAPPVVTNKDVEQTKPDPKPKDPKDKPNSEKDSEIGKNPKKDTGDAANITKGLGIDSSNYGMLGGKDAEPIGGFDEFALYISKNVKYPPELKGTKIGGTIYVYFEVDTNGVIDKVKIMAGLNAYLDAEAMRVVKSSPKWKPATQGPVKVRIRKKIGVKINPTIQ